MKAESKIISKDGAIFLNPVERGWTTFEISYGTAGVNFLADQSVAFEGSATAYSTAPSSISIIVENIRGYG